MPLHDRRFYICTLPAADSDTRQALTTTTDLRRVVVRISPRPRTNSATELPTWTDLAAALGKDYKLGGSRRNVAGARADMQAWLLAEGTRQLVVVDAHDARRLWQQFVEIAALVGCELWLAVDDRPPGRFQRAFVDCWQFQRRDVTDILEAPASISEPELPERAFPAVPEDDWCFFIDACRRVLNPTDYDLVEHEYNVSFDRFRDYLLATARDEDEVAGYLLWMIRSTQSTHVAVTRLRAAQAAALSCEYRLEVWTDKLLGSELFASRLTVETIAALKRYAKASPAMVALLTILTGASLEAMTEMRMRDADRSGASVLIDGQRYDIPPEARTLVRAHRIQREMETATEEHPFFACDTAYATPAAAPTVSSLKRQRSMVRRRGGVRVARQSEQKRRRRDGSLGRLGVSFKPLRKGQAA